MKQYKAVHRCARSVVFLAAVLGLMGSQAVRAQGLPEESSRPYYVQVPMQSFHLNTLVYAPPGKGPWPVVIMNHGKNYGPAHTQLAQPYAMQARLFNTLGYAVVIPTRAGFGASGGNFLESCDTARLGRVDAASIEAAVDWVRTQPRFDAGRIVLVGQSTGGLSSVALAERNLPGIRAVISFSGGFKKASCGPYIRAAQEAFKQYGEKAKEPTLMFYGTNDEYFGDQGPTFFAYYHQGNPNSEFYNEGRFKSNSHLFFGDEQGARIWYGVVRQFLAEHGLPAKQVFAVQNHIRWDSMHHVTPDSYQLYKPAPVGMVGL